jgi:predicted GNAT family acetyltransferase
MTMEVNVVHNEAASRFEARFDEGLAVAVYRLVGSEMQMTHTEVPPSLEGHGIAAQLVAAALEHAENQGWSVRPLCSYVRSYMQRNPDTLDLLAR